MKTRGATQLVTALVVTALAIGVLCASFAPATGAVPRATAAGARPSWAALLDRAGDLGPSRAPTASALVGLRTARRPVALLGWAASHRLRAIWFTGQPTVLLAGRPARLGRARRMRS